MTYHTAHGAMLAILDCNETIERLKNLNTDNILNPDIGDIATLLIDYRDLLEAELKATTLQVFKKVDYDN